MKYSKMIDVVMVPTSDVTLITKGVDVGGMPPHLILSKDRDGDDWDRFGVYQELYFLSDEEILTGDHYLTDAGAFRCTHESKRELSNFRKIVGTTNRKIVIDLGHVCLDHLPQPSMHFVNAYVQEGGIDRVMVEFERLVYCPENSYRDNISLRDDMTLCDSCVVTERVKVDERNRMYLE